MEDEWKVNAGKFYIYAWLSSWMNLMHLFKQRLRSWFEIFLLQIEIKCWKPPHASLQNDVNKSFPEILNFL